MTTSHSDHLVHHAESVVKQAMQEIIGIDHELFIRNDKNKDAMGRLHIRLFLALQEFKENIK